MDSKIDELYGNRLRIRVCGLLWQNDCLLLINHRNLTESGNFWAPPGGGMSFGETAEEALKREFKEETGLTILIGRFMGVFEFRKPPLHAVELFFEILPHNGSLYKGYDPEMAAEEQIIKEIEFKRWDDIQQMDPTDRHGIFSAFSTKKSLKSAFGYWKI